MLTVPMYLDSIQGFPGGSDGKVSACNAGDLGSIPGLGRSPGEGNGSPLQYFFLEYYPVLPAALHSPSLALQPSCLHYEMPLLPAVYIHEELLW